VLGPLPRHVLPVYLPVSSRKASASPHDSQVRHVKYSLQCNFNRGAFSGLQSFRYVQAPMLARPSGCTYRCGLLPTEQPGRLHHAMNVWLPDTNRGIATYPNQAIGMVGLSPTGMRPCRPLPNRFAQSYFQTDRIHYFDIRYSLFDILRFAFFCVVNYYQLSFIYADT
jgi:hypothetical protein